jgi:GNAT superfamily N-acetyltransferase
MPMSHPVPLPPQFPFVDFPGDYSSLAELMSRSWRENAEQPLDYSGDFLRSCLEYPGMTPALAPTILTEGRPAAFVAGFPRTLSVGGRPGRYALLTFFTVAPELKGQGLGVAIWAECLRRARAAGFDGALHYCVDGNISNRVTAAGARAAGFEAVRVFTVPYLMRFLRPAAQPPPPEPISDGALSFLETSALGLASRIPISRLWSADETDWQLRRRSGACATWGPDGGLLSGYVMRIADADRTPCLFIDEIHWGDLTAEGCSSLLARFLSQASAEARLAIVPLLGYVDAAGLQRAGFRRSTRLLHAYLTCWNGPAAGPADALYTDVI